jgi:hypothetical protein
MFKKIFSNLDLEIQNFSRVTQKMMERNFDPFYVQILLVIPTHTVVVT